MKFLPSVSVILPVYNQACYVEESILSVFAQSYTNFELLIIDDASTDGTNEIIAKFADDPRVSLYRNEQNLGCAKTFNHGYSLATGDYYCIIAGDDTYEPEYIKKTVSALAVYPNAGFVYTRVNLMDEKGIKRPRGRDRIKHQRDHYGDEFEDIVRWMNHIPHASILVRRECVEEAGFYDPDLTATFDWEFMVRLTKKFPVVFINEHLYNIRIHETNVTKSRVRKGEREVNFIRLLDRVYQMDDLPQSLIDEKEMIYARAYLDVAEGYREIKDYGNMRQFAFKALSHCKKPALYLPYRRLIIAMLGFQT
jgi:glycosyltransferase involved in cell wall biosynthesis